MIIFGVDFSKGVESWKGGVTRSLTDESRFTIHNGEHFYDLAGVSSWTIAARHWLKHKDGFNIRVRLRRTSAHTNYSYLFTAYNGVDYVTGTLFGVFEDGRVTFQIGHGSDSPTETKITTPPNTLALSETADFILTYDRLGGYLTIHKNDIEIDRLQTNRDISVEGVREYVMGGDPRRVGRIPNLLINHLIVSSGTTLSSDNNIIICENESIPVFVVRGSIKGQVLIKGVPAIRQVLCISRGNKAVVAKTWSKIDGGYQFDNLVRGSEYVCLALDHERNYNAVIQDMLRAE